MDLASSNWPEENPLASVPALTNDSIHVWCCSLDDPPLPGDQLWRVLNHREQARAERYAFQRDRTRSAASRGLLRWLLGAHLDVPSDDVRLRLGQYGKPELDEQHASSGLSFNVAHSSDIVVYAVTRRREIGVDIEHLRPMSDAADVATRFFARSELEALLALPPAQVDEGFFVCWTRKEAYVKARGVGLALPLDAFEVRLDHGQGSDRLQIPADPDQAPMWWLYDLRPFPTVLGSVAVNGEKLQLRCRLWTGGHASDREDDEPSGRVEVQRQRASGPRHIDPASRHVELDHR